MLRHSVLSTMGRRRPGGRFALSIADAVLMEGKTLGGHFVEYWRKERRLEEEDPAVVVVDLLSML